jgi:tryptophan synthase beta chain
MRYHGISPLISALYREKKIEAKAYTQLEAFDAAIQFARTEGMVSSTESSYALAAVLDEAFLCKKENKQRDILFLLDANSNLDLITLKNFIDGAIESQSFPTDKVQVALEQLPKVSP